MTSTDPSPTFPEPSRDSLLREGERLRDENRRLRRRLRRLTRELQAVKDRLSRDPLTGLAHRGQADEWLEELAALGPPLSCILIDLDAFKSINSELGHAAGDAALREVARLLSER